jgi:hypothetical protein
MEHAKSMMSTMVTGTELRSKEGVLNTFETDNFSVVFETSEVHGALYSVILHMYLQDSTVPKRVLLP